MVPTNKTTKPRFSFWRKAAPITVPQSPTDANPKEAPIKKVDPAEASNMSVDDTKAVAADAVLLSTTRTPTADATVTLDNSTAKEDVKDDVDVSTKKYVLKTFVSFARTKATTTKTAVKTASGKAAAKTKKVFCCFSKQ